MPDSTLQSSNRALVGGHTTVECRDVRSVLGNVLVGGVELIAHHRIAAARGDGAVGNTGDARGDACTGCVVGGAVEQPGVVEYAVDCRIELVELIADGCARLGHGCLADTADY